MGGGGGFSVVMKVQMNGELTTGKWGLVSYLAQMDSNMEFGGAGMKAAELTGEENADEMRRGPDGKPVFLSNHAGGILGGISTGQEIVVRFAVKPTSSILSARQTVTVEGRNTDISTKGRHDPCVGIRAVPIGEAMLAIVLADHFLRHRGQVG